MSVVYTGAARLGHDTGLRRAPAAPPLEAGGGTDPTGPSEGAEHGILRGPAMCLSIIMDPYKLGSKGNPKKKGAVKLSATRNEQNKLISSQFCLRHMF